MGKNTYKPERKSLIPMALRGTKYELENVQSDSQYWASNRASLSDETNRPSLLNLATSRAKGVAAGLIAGAIALSTGCATPQGIQNRRALYSQGRLNGNAQLEARANNSETYLGVGVNINFNNLREIPGEATGALGAFGYGLIRPGFKEFWEPGEYSGLSPFMSKGWESGRKAESVGELTRYLAIISGVVAASSGGGSSSKEEPTYNPEPERRPRAPEPEPEPAPKHKEPEPEEPGPGPGVTGL
jgi:hypothetical protein